jgi:hypothetical protein
MPSASENSVEITANYGEWFVRVMQDGHEHVQAFEAEALASAYAEEQRSRLHLEAVKLNNHDLTKT